MQPISKFTGSLAMAIIISLASLLPHRILNHQHKKNVWIISRTNGNAYATVNRWNSESRSQTCLDYAEISCKREQSQACLAMPSAADIQRKLIAKEEDEVNYRSNESRTLSMLNCYAECRRKLSLIKRLNLFKRLS